MARRPQNRFRRGTKGFNGSIYVVPAVAAAAVANYQAFAEAEDPIGQLGVFDALTNELVTAALEEGQEFYLAQRRASQEPGGVTDIKKTGTYVYRKKGIRGVDYVAPVKDQYTITLPGYTPEKGDEISLKFIETADESFAPPTMEVTVAAKAGDTVTTIYAALAEAINNYAPAVGLGDDPFVEATSSGTGLVVTHLFDQASFRVATPGLSYDYANIVHTRPAVYGSGFYEEVRQLEYEGNVFDGVTTQYPGAGFVPDDFASPNDFAVSTVGYQKIAFSLYKDEYSPTPVNKHHHLKHAVLVIDPAGDSATALNTIFGLEEGEG